MLVGYVKWYDERKGFGFIAPKEGGSDVFVHASALPDGMTSLPEGASVEYEIKSTPRGDTVVKLQLA